jgi:hypothetical protein
VSGLQENWKHGIEAKSQECCSEWKPTTDEELICFFFQLKNVFAGRFTQYFILPLKVFKRKCIEFVPSICLLSRSGTPKHLQAKKEIGNIVWVRGVMVASFRNKVAESLIGMRTLT